MTAELRPKLIGARVQRREDPRLLTGNGAFVDDRRLHGTLHLAFRRSDHAHARIAAIDAAEAAAMPGVVAIVTARDIEDEVQPIRATSRMPDYQATELWPLARDKVRHVGEPVVALLAENRYLAEDALEHVVVDYEPLGEVTDAEAAAAPGSALLHEAAGSNILVERAFQKGDPDEIMGTAPVRVGGRFRVRRKTPVAIENRCYLADYDRGRQSLTLHSTTQVPGIVRDALAEVLGLPGNRLRVVAPDVGGGFGGKGSLYPEEILVCALARRLGRPVKWTGDRLEDLMSTSQAFDERVEAELAVDADGRILALRAEVIGDIGAYSIYPWTAALEPGQVISFLPGPYRVPCYRGRVRAVATSKPPTGPYRGVGRPVSTFVMERLLDMAGWRLGQDPVAIRRRNLVPVDEFPYKTASGIVWDHADLNACLEAALDGIDYDGLRRRQAAARAEGRWLGIGVACYAELTGIGSRISAAPGMPINTGTENATVRIDSTGAVSAFFGVAAHGQGLETTLAQVVAEELGVAVEDVEIVQGDSAAVAHSTGSYASRGTVLAGGAATLAARAVREKVIEAASHLFEAAAADIEVAEGRVRVAGTDRAMSFPELARAVYSEMGRLDREVRADIDLEATKLYDPYFGTTTPATHVCLVEIDPETYEVTGRRYLVAEDCGRIINPQIADGQVHGGVAQGIGAALYEEVVHDGDGQLLTASLVDYVVPSAAEIPPLEVIHLETAPPANIGGFRGIGEGGTIGALAAVANAVSDALAPLGVEVTEVPVTPERLYRLIEAAKQKT
ncbi:MAG: xanthine dehydrogenase family protein molybdopterin-binding subunit [Alphaproteobacteria bacterium]|jgi:carbon-monoxide dehydrogenase large subunit|nr:xanthine dehydrogenase family protein molybdopterin-binding subunit [Alphaproteobacteria bacterium]